MCLLTVPLAEQVVTGQDTNPVSGAPTTTFGTINVNSTFLKDWIVGGKVRTLEGNPVHGAKVVVQPLSTAGDFRTVKTDLQGEFRTDYQFNTDTVKELSVELTISMKGFLEAHQIIDFGGTDKFWVIPVTLRDAKEDPNLLSQADLASDLAPKLKDLGANDGLSANSEKDYARGVQEFLDRGRADRALPLFSRVVKRDPKCAACRTMLGLAELNSGDLDGGDRNFGEAVNTILADRKLGRPEPFVAYGAMHSWRHDPDKAAPFFAEALKFDAKDSLALQELGRSELLLQNWSNAASHLSQALDAGAKPEARLLLVEALLNAGSAEEANKEMTRYLDGNDVKQMPLRVRQLWAQVQDKKKVEVAYAEVSSAKVQTVDFLRHNPPELKGIVPAEDQKPLESILTGVGKNVALFFQNFPNTSALEQIHQEKLRHKGKVGASQDQKFHYLCIVPSETTGPGFSEYRADLSGGQGQPRGLQEGFMLTNGFASASLIFHPVYQRQSTFRYLGRQKLNGRDTHVIAFAQQPKKARLNGVFKSGEVTMLTFTQGLAWVDASTYQILRIRTDLLTPLPAVRLERETTEIDYGEVHFKTLAEAFWLPRAVTVTVGWNGKNLRNEHEYSDFKLFNVASSQKVRNPKGQEINKNENGPGA